MIVIGVMISLFIRNEYFKRFFDINKIIFNFKIHLRD
jgi:hypothetical protein